MNEDQDDEEFLQQYRKQRMEEMRQQLYQGPQFKQVFEIPSGEGFLDMIDKEQRSTLIMVHIYEDGIPGTEAMNGCMLCLAAEYPAVKFCRVRSSVIGASSRFTRNALPALLIYKGGELIGNFVRVTDQLGKAGERASPGFWANSPMEQGLLEVISAMPQPRSTRQPASAMLNPGVSSTPQPLQVSSGFLT